MTLGLLCTLIVVFILLYAAGWLFMISILGIIRAIMRLVKRNSRTGPDPYAGPADPLARKDPWA